MNDNLGDLINNMSDETTHRERPFTGQRWTIFGERGKTEVTEISLRDLADCAARAFVISCPNQIALGETDDALMAELRKRVVDGTLNYNDLFSLDLSEMDPVAFIQNLCCQVERSMGIFPIIPEGEGLEVP